MRQCAICGRVVGADLKRAGHRLWLRGRWHGRRGSGGVMGGGDLELELRGMRLGVGRNCVRWGEVGHEVAEVVL